MTDSDRTASFASRNDMSRLQRRLSSGLARIAASPKRRAFAQRTRQRLDALRGRPHEVHYFHQVDDPYSHLAVQALSRLSERYDVTFVPHLAATETGPNLPEPELLVALAIRDCASLAPHFGLHFPGDAKPLDASAVQAAQDRLAAALAQGAEAFASLAVELGKALWSGETTRAAGSTARGAQAAAEGSALREKLGHYSGAMFHDHGEWYWGIDRLHHLERHWAEIGRQRPGFGNEAPCFPRPPLETEAVPGADAMTLEVFPSLRSPYTAIGFEPTLRLAEQTGVRLEVRPVLPMVMRGVPATLRKGIYIFTDAAREGAMLEMPFGRMIDPIGEPVRRAYALWPWAQAQGKGAALIASFLRAAFAEAVDTSTDAGLREVVERAGLSWSDAQAHRSDDGWEGELEANRLAMVRELGQWGVPSYRLRGPEGFEDLSCWGQDRLWLISREIQRRGREGARR